MANNDAMKAWSSPPQKARSGAMRALEQHVILIALVAPWAAMCHWHFRVSVGHDRQTLFLCGFRGSAFFSATMVPKILDSTTKFMRNVVRILVGKDKLILADPTIYVPIEKAEWKFDTFCDVYGMLTVTQAVHNWIGARWNGEDCNFCHWILAAHSSLQHSIFMVV